MHVVTVDSFGGPEVLKYISAPDPDPGAGQVVITVEAAAVGSVDAMMRIGKHPRHLEPHFVPGLEVAGTVTALGSGVDSIWLGRKVYAMTQGGAYAEQAVTDAGNLVAIPDPVSCVDAVALGVNALVARYALEKSHQQPGEEVLVRGAGGGVGLATVQMALAQGASVTAISSTEDRMERLRALGVRKVMDRDGVKGSSDEYDIVVDPVAGPDLGAHLARLRPNGRYTLVGAAAGMPDGGFGMAIVEQPFKSLTIGLASLASLQLNERNAMTLAILQVAAEGGLAPVIDTTYPLAEAAAAHARLDAGDVFGRLVLAPDAALSH